MSFGNEKNFGYQNAEGITPENTENFAHDFIVLAAKLKKAAMGSYNPANIRDIEHFSANEKLKKQLENVENTTEVEMVAREMMDNISREKHEMFDFLSRSYRKYLEGEDIEKKLPMIRKTMRYGSPDNGSGALVEQSLRKLASEKTPAGEAIDETVDFIRDHPQSGVYYWEVGWVLNRQLRYSTQKLWKLIMDAGSDKEVIKRAVLFLDKLKGSELLRDDIARLIQKTKNAGEMEIVSNLEKAYALITPNDDKEAIFNLKEFYQNNIHFEEYKVNEDMNEKEVELLKGMLGKEDKVLEMGCGTGRLIKELVKDGRDVSGYDFTARHVEITKAEIEKEGGEAKVFQGDWHENAVKEESLDTVYSLGRNILHDYSIVDQAQLFREAARILKKGGRFILDIPNREKGGYKKMVDGYSEEMKKRGIKNFRYGSIYDSPDGEHFATRYAYSQEDIEELARLAGFRIREMRKLPLETGQEDENLYYVLEKL